MENGDSKTGGLGLFINFLVFFDGLGGMAFISCFFGGFWDVFFRPSISPPIGGRKITVIKIDCSNF